MSSKKVNPKKRVKNVDLWMEAMRANAKANSLLDRLDWAESLKMKKSSKAKRKRAGLRDAELAGMKAQGQHKLGF